MRVLLSSFRNKDLVDVAYKLRQKDIGIAYWIGGQTAHYYAARDDKKTFPDTIFHEGIDCLHGIPAFGVNPYVFEPPSKDFLHSLFSCESQVLSMMNSFDQSNVPLSRKKQLYYGYVRYWYGVLSRLKINAVLFHDIPHSPYDYVIFCLAKKMGIKTVMYVTFRLPDRLIFIDDFPDFGEVASAYQKILQQPFSFDMLSPDLQRFYHGQSAEISGGMENNETPYYQVTSNIGIAPMRVLPSPRAIVKNIRQGTFIKSAYRYLAMLPKTKEIANLERYKRRYIALKYEFYKWRRKREQFKKEYEQFVRIPDMSKNFIFVPLSMQPERSTSSQGDIFVNLPLMIESLSAALPKGWLIYVKEHPAQWVAQRTHLGRYPGYYEHLAKIPSVVLVPSSIPSKVLIARARAVAAVTSTAIWEAALIGKPAIMFGYDWYMHCEGVFRAGDSEEARQALFRIENGYTPDKTNVMKFLYALDTVAVRGYGRRKFDNKTYISHEQQVENIADAFYTRMLK